MTNAWSFLTLDPHDIQFVAHESHYSDVLGSQYPFDTTVPNHGSVAVGDLAVLRNSDVVLGIGWIDAVDVHMDQRKTRLRCPECRRTGFKRRRHLRPEYKCPCGQAFDQPAEELVRIDVYVADYERTWQPADLDLSRRVLDEAYLSRANQQSIRRLDMAVIRGVLGPLLAPGEAWWQEDGGVRPDIRGGHKVRVGPVRIGQQPFREMLLGRFGNVCAFTGVQHPAALQAAHLYRFSDRPEHDSDGGLLLRADLHTLFDRWLITVEPGTWLIRVAPELREYPHLAALDGSELHIDRGARPNEEHLTVHHALALDRWRAHTAASAR